MMHRTIDCPHCGNPTTATSVSEAQKCKYCRRLFKIKITKRRQKSRKLIWEAEAIDFPDKPQPTKADRAQMRRVPFYDRDKFF